MPHLATVKGGHACAINPAVFERLALPVIQRRLSAAISLWRIHRGNGGGRGWEAVRLRNRLGSAPGGLSRRV